MKAWIWIIALVCVVNILATRALIASVQKAGDAAVVWNTPSNEVLRTDSNSTAAPNVEGGIASSSASTSALEARSVTLSACGDERLECVALRAAASETSSGRAPASVASNDARERSSTMSTLDLGLMLLFAAGLIAYQLDRKQRELRQSSLFSASV